MARKKSKKKDLKKKKLKKKELKKKGTKKKDKKKKDLKKKNAKRKTLKEKILKHEPQDQAPIKQKVVAISGLSDHSSNYNVKLALSKMRSLKNQEDLTAFTKGEKRVTVTRVIPAAMNRLEK